MNHNLLSENFYIRHMGVMATPAQTVGDFQVRPGLFQNNGAVETAYGVSFTIHTHFGTRVELLLFHIGEEEPYAVIPFPEEYRIGDVRSMMVYGLNIEDFEYAFRIDGPKNRKKGMKYDKEAILLDPYAKIVTGQSIWGKKRQKAYHGMVVNDLFDWGVEEPPHHAITDLVIYELHVRGFTRHSSSKVQCPGTFAGLKEKIPYLKELGINAVELMPIFEFDENMEERTWNGNTLVDFWGYNSVSFFAPNSSYIAEHTSQNETIELKELIRAFHDNGIEVILDVVFNHTAEGNEKGPMFCFKGIDNNIYYMMTPDGFYYNFSGCGNTMNCNHPVVRQLILDCLRYWTVHYRIDGFRFDLASILGRYEDGTPMVNPPLLELISDDPLLAHTKLIAEAWDAGGMYQVGSFPASGRWAEWNGRYRDSLRAFLKGDSWEAAGAARSIAGSPDLYDRETTNRRNSYAGYNSSVNFLTCHDGFTLYDLYSYNWKHNENNGWNNTDGANDNRSWNCGVEGETDDPEVLKLRFRMIRNACAVLMCSRGTPMFFSGDEFGNTQMGNNNAYCQDNEITWLDWSLQEKNRDLYEFFKFMIAYRQAHPVIRKRLPRSVGGMNEIALFDMEGNTIGVPENAFSFAVCFAGYDKSRGIDDVVYLAINTHWEEAEIRLPQMGFAYSWYLTVNTAGDEEGRYFYPRKKEPRMNGTFRMGARSVAVFTARIH